MGQKPYKKKTTTGHRDTDTQRENTRKIGKIGGEEEKTGKDSL